MIQTPELGRVAPYGVYDIAANHGWVSVGIDADTGPSPSRASGGGGKLGKPRYPNASCLTITAIAAAATDHRSSYQADRREP